MTSEKLTLVIQLTLILGLVEGLVVSTCYEQLNFEWRYSATAIIDLCISELVNVVLHLGPAYLLALFVWPYRIQTIAMESWLAWALLIVLSDFLYYVMHRTSHHIPILWCHHSIHHTPNRLSMINANIGGIVTPISGTALFYAPLVLFGFPPMVVFKVVTCIIAYQRCVHLEWFPKLHILDKILVTPSNHRLHHAVNDEFINSNFGGVSVIFDHIFGTFKDEPQDRSVLRYGLVAPQFSYNPAKIIFRGYLELFHSLRQSRSVVDTLRRLLGPI